MTYRGFRRRFGEALAAHDWLEGVSFVLGVGFVFLALACAWGIGTSLTNAGDAESPPGMNLSIGSLEVTRGFAVVFFALFGSLALGVAWFLAGGTIRRWLRRGRRRV
jgi:threonine/homoserine/homoserine lactone efflux protein